jgi:hypothetical protein
MTADPLMKVLYELPERNSNVQFLGSSIIYEYYRDDTVYRGGIRFKHVAAACERSEKCEMGWRMKAFEKLVQVEDSEWARQIRAELRPSPYEDATNHYLIYIYDVGSFEAIADSWELLPEEKGEWPIMP